MNTLSQHTAVKTALMNVLGLIIFITASITVSTSAWAVQDPETWQMQRLLHPTPAQRERERQGQVFIYDGLTDKDVERAMDLGFDRLSSMMFVNVKKTKDVSGAATEEGPEEPDDDGCE